MSSRQTVSSSLYIPQISTKSPVALSVSKGSIMSCLVAHCSLSSLVTFAFVLALVPPPMSLKSHDPPQSLESINVTLRKKMIEQKFLQTVLHKIHKSNLSNIGNTTGMNLRDNHPGGPSSYSNRTTSQVVTEKSPTVEPGNLIKSESPSKNVLTFRFHPDIINGRTIVTRINLWLFVNKTDTKGKVAQQDVRKPSQGPQSRELNKRKGKKIKIRVFLINANNVRIQKIAELKKSIDSDNWQKLSLPVSLISTIAQSQSNNTLYLRVECKKCNRKAFLNLPGNCTRKPQSVNRKKEGRTKRKRSHCPDGSTGRGELKPFISIEEKHKGSRRVKRASLDQPKNDLAGCNTETADGQKALIGDSHDRTHDCCTPGKTFVELSDLQLDDVIVSPSGFDYVTCSGMCPNSLPHHRKLHSKRLLDKNRIRQWHKASHHLHRFSQSSPMAAADNQLNDHHDRLQRFKDHYWHKHKWSRSKSVATCAPVETENLVILHFTHDKKLVQSTIPNFLVTKCGCKSQDRPNK